MCVCESHIAIVNHLFSLSIASEFLESFEESKATELVSGSLI